MPNSGNTNITTMAWNFAPINSGLTEIYIYDAIAEKQSVNWWDGEKGTEVTPTLFAEELKKVETPEICIRINSGGGDVFAAEAIRTQIREKRASGTKVTCKIDGLCASAAVGVASACETVAIPASGYFMIHNPAAFVYGYFTSAEFEKGKSVLDKVKQGIINVYSHKTGKSEEEISELMTAETWYTGDEAVKNGFCDELMFEDENKSETAPNSPAVSNVFNAAMYRNCPIPLLNSRPQNRSGLLNTQNQKGVKKTMDIQNVEELKAAYPALTAQIINEAAAAERKRIQDIEDVALAGFDEIISKAKFETPEMSAAEVAMGIIAKQKQQGAAYLAGAMEDVVNSGADGVAVAGHEGSQRNKTNPYDTAIDNLFPVNM